MEEKRHFIKRFFEEWLEVPFKEGIIEFIGTSLFVLGGYICLIVILMIA